ncbi:MAG: ornithine cyclodeaminase family protein [Burkholderiales bacterium]|nr:ornithine cyclodeaminase family protein [Burkholderiales bacterium]
MRFIDAETTRRHLGFGPLIEALRQMFSAGCEVPLRHTHTVGDGTLLLMPAWRAGRRLGIKTVTIFPGNSALGQPGLHSTYLLFDAATGVPLAQLDGDQITSRRTAAASALAASFLARTDASRLLIVGTGRVASLIAEAMQAVRPITEVVVWNHRAASAEALAGRLREQGFNARASTDLAAAVVEADIVSCATLSTTALIRGDWLQPGTHLDLIGSFTPAMCEADAACFQRSRVFVDTLEALAKSGDVLRAFEAGAFEPDQLAGTLGDLCRGTRPGRGSATQITLFKAVGTALEDLAAAERIWDAVQADSLSLAPAPFTDQAP